MRKTTLWALAALAFGCAAPPALADDFIDDLTTDCTVEWPGDFAMIEWCVERQWEAAVTLQKVPNVMTPEKDPALSHCIQEWHDPARVSPDWAMVLWCYERQTAAKTRLGM